ncbi:MULTISPECIES: ketopantoate reductase family protein [Mycobacterium avium complex (MAC)]|jgi:2-dehydropantoate 2-reductase|uniref:2-dehydropantoate 2-reductase n=7 Tax=Mycobacterium avium complex (MAC) TaxID=120793 RepID=A0A2A3L7B4_MYCAV|nr:MULTISPECIES: 2-dehydropantoate 2-reductase [Mycobacterium avium complex (MAC)]ETA90440.1 2-dehydropantoate 2-reductase [Mycobacterium avium 05-4293]ETA93534.1 2-dehydropantoate 2-reductase [Mycobacterium avium 10-5581]ETB04646.1 2-dehydropantoate 2-reductase [Mycobacterium avium subsp. silvaticum ATCC 49884]ETB11313.1 2-dehydropantoate 2-reductase [Mycobacterium avium subsp. avium 10-9275]ETB17177.1 2-dehydropantoate 2-reductase [Mycobacterium avium subsp. avium 11-4751]ETB19725.1 2-dehyd
MKIAVIGCGAMGSIYAAKLAAAGEQVLAVDRHRPSVERINRDGLRVTGPGCDQVVPLRASTGAVDETMDLVVLAVKAADVEAAARQALPMLGPDTAVLTIQNGLGSAETVAGVVGAQRVAVGIASGFGASRVAPGHVHHNAMRAMRFGPYSSLPHARVESIARTWAHAGFDAAAVTDIAAMQWEKLICNVAYSAPCALTGMTVGQVMDDAEMGPVSRAAATEAWSVARASGVAIAVADAVEHVRAFGAQMPDAKPSALLDHEARRVSEIDVINGAVPRQGARVGVDAPVNATLTAVVKSIERRWR